MTCLTENIVLSRTRAQDLNSVRKLNCWGSELSDVSLVRKMPFVEVLSLSVNSISTLYDFSFCKNLQELYIRKNNILDLNEVCYLQDLPRLKFLWLADNPCAECDHYRLTVLRTLPSLVKLDNVTVQPQEVDLAKTQGRVLVHPSKAVKQQVETPPPGSGICVSTASTTNIAVTERATSRASIHEDNCNNTTSPALTERVSATITRQSSSSEICENSFNLKQRKNIKNESVPEPDEPRFPDGSLSNLSSMVSPGERDPLSSQHAQQVHPTFQQSSHVIQSQQQQQQYSAGSSSHNISHHNHAFYARVQTLVDHTSRRPKKPTEFKCETRRSVSGSLQALNLTEDSPNDYQTGDTDSYYNVVDNSDARSSLDSETSYYGDQRSAQRSDKGSPTRVLPKGGRNRNSNILSAVLCLIKELDYASLEVVETAIHCQMEELEN